MLLDGSDEAAANIKEMLFFDVVNGLARRGWARNEGAIFASDQAMKLEPGLQITKPHVVNDELIDDIIK